MHPINNERQLLIVEDDASTRVLYKKTLTRHGWKCLEAHNINDAMTILKDLTIHLDLVLLDFGLPDGEPWSVLEITKRQSRSIPVIVATGAGDEKLASKCIGAGAVDYIIKSGNYWEILPPAIERAITIKHAINDASKLAAIVSSSPDPMYSLNIDGAIESWNQAAERLYGYTSSEALGTPLIDIIEPKYQARISRCIEKAKKRKGSRIKCAHRSKTGEEIPIISVFSPIYDSNDAPYGIAVVEQDLRPILQTQALEEQTKSLTKINQELDQFAAVVAHDLQSPLGTASLQIDMIIHANEHNEIKNQLLSAQSLIDRSRKMIERILEYARESTVDTSHDKILDTNKISKAVIEGLQPVILESLACIEVATLPNLFFDELQIIRIFQNLISNSIKYRHSDRKPHIRIQPAMTDSDYLIHIDIIDNSIGIPESQVHDIFDLFKQFNQDNTNNESHGIGLAVCRKLIEARGGTLSLVETSDKGSTFRISLPKRAPHKSDDGSGAHLLP